MIDALLLALQIGLAGAVAVSITIFLLDRQKPRFDERPAATETVADDNAHIDALCAKLDAQMEQEIRDRARFKNASNCPENLVWRPAERTAKKGPRRYKGW